jgi:uncharacterized membrane protein YtjA (UPF0391 family)
MRSENGGINMKLIPRFYHGVIDYISALLLLIAPNLFGFSGVGGAAVWVPRIIGLMILLQALSTDYELGLIKLIPISMHLMTDYMLSIVMLVSPLLFGFYNDSRGAMILMMAMGLIGLAAAFMTQPRGRPREVMA